MELRAVITREVFMHPALAGTSGAPFARRGRTTTRPSGTTTPRRHWAEKCVDLGASPRATILLVAGQGAGAARYRRADVYPEDIEELARYALPHRVSLGPHAASHGVSVDMVIEDARQFAATRCRRSTG